MITFNVPIGPAIAPGSTSTSTTAEDGYQAERSYDRLH
jgi:hypothetical protein